MPVPDGLSTLVHFYNDERFLFVTVTMYLGQERDRALDELVRNRAWYSGRYSDSERSAYLLCRETVEQLMYAEFAQNYWKPPTTAPVYFYIYPNLESEEQHAYLEDKARSEGHNTRVMTLRLNEISHTRSISFTVEDSHQSYRKILEARGITVKGGRPSDSCAESRGKLFHVDQLESIYAKHRDHDGLYFEAQVWEPAALEPIKQRLRAGALRSPAE
jgi:hypothetical protein